MSWLGVACLPDWHTRNLDLTTVCPSWTNAYLLGILLWPVYEDRYQGRRRMRRCFVY